MINLLTLIAVAALVGCATTSSTPVGQVQEVGPGTYKIGYSHTVRIGHEMEDEAVSKAGQYCHDRGRKLQVVPSKGSDVIVFRCEGELIQGSAPVELKVQKQQDQTKGAGQN